MSEKAGPDYFFLLHEVERLREENQKLREERERIWNEAERALRIERQFTQLLMTVQEARELHGS